MGNNSALVLVVLCGVIALAQSASLNAGYKARPKRQAYDPCAYRPCQNGATCFLVSYSPGYRCYCYAGYSGDRCQYSNSTSGNSTYSGGYYYGNSTGGNTTSGNTTSGNTTNGNTTYSYYYGNSTGGNTTNGNTTNGNSTFGGGYYYGNSTGGNTTNGNTTNGNSTCGGGYYCGNSTGGNITSGNTTNGNTTYGGGYFYGNSTGGNSTSGNATSSYNSCLSQPCVNGGVCQAGSAGGYSCLCPMGFYGVNCQQNQQDYINEIWRQIMASFQQAGNIFGRK